jgi:hypothetical protein
VAVTTTTRGVTVAGGGGGGVAWAARAATVASSWTKWETDPAKIAAAREDLAKAVLAKK